MRVNMPRKCQVLVSLLLACIMLVTSMPVVPIAAESMTTQEPTASGEPVVSAEPTAPAESNNPATSVEPEGSGEPVPESTEEVQKPNVEDTDWQFCDLDGNALTATNGWYQKDVYLAPTAGEYNAISIYETDEATGTPAWTEWYTKGYQIANIREGFRGNIVFKLGVIGKAEDGTEVLLKETNSCDLQNVEINGVDYTSPATSNDACTASVAAAAADETAKCHYFNQAVTFTAMAEDTEGGSGMDYYEFVLHGGDGEFDAANAAWEKVTLDEEGKGKFTIDGDAKKGVLYWRAVDRAGNKSVVQAYANGVTVCLDMSAPENVTEIIGVAAADDQVNQVNQENSQYVYFRNGQITLNVTAEDLSGIKEVQYAVMEEKAADMSAIADSSWQHGTDENGAESMLGSKVLEGNREIGVIYVKVTDLLGHAAYKELFDGKTVILDTTGPNADAIVFEKNADAVVTEAAGVLYSQNELQMAVVYQDAEKEPELPQYAYMTANSAKELLENIEKADAKWESCEALGKTAGDSEQKQKIGKILTQGFSGAVAFRVTDAAGNATIKCFENKDSVKEIVVDNEKPITKFAATVDGGTEYDSKWTDKNVVVMLSEAPAEDTTNRKEDGTVVAGIKQFEYLFIPAGFKGNIEEESKKTENWTVLKPGTNLTIDKNTNGTYYFRACSNSGVYGEAVTLKVQIQKDSNYETKLEVEAKLADDADEDMRVNEWYNNKSKAPSLKMVVTDHEKDATKAPLTCKYTWKVKDREEGSFVPVEGYEDGREYVLSTVEAAGAEIVMPEITDDGIYELAVELVDQFGNTVLGSQKTYTYKYDKTAPNVTLSYAPANGWIKKLKLTQSTNMLFFSEKVTIMADANDSFSGVQRYDFYDALSSEETPEVTKETAETQVSIDVPPIGAKKYKVVVTDQAGNSNDATGDHFVADKTEGTTTVSAKTINAQGEVIADYTGEAAAWTQDNVEITLSDGSNLVSGVDYYEYVFISQRELDVAQEQDAENGKKNLIDERIKEDSEAWQRVQESSGAVTHVTDKSSGQEMLGGIETAVQGNGVTVKGKEGYYVADQLTISEKCPEMDADGYINGYYYFRSVSNTGIIGEVSDAQPVMVQKKPVSGCSFAVAHKYGENESVEENAAKDALRVNTWYNKASGLPTIFVQEAHDKYQAPLTVTYELKKNAQNTRNDADYVVVEGHEEKSVWLENSSYKQETAGAIDQLLIKEEGVYKVTVTVKDVLGNLVWENTEKYIRENAKDQYEFKCDITEPTVNLSYSSENDWFKKLKLTEAYTLFFGEEVTITANADASISGVQQYEFYNTLISEDTPEVTKETSETKASIAVSPVAEKKYKVRVTDQAGNSNAAIKEESFVTDNKEGYTGITAQTTNAQGEETDYTGEAAEWTQDDVVITLYDNSDLKSGVDYFEYAFISQKEIDNGVGVNNLSEDQWKPLWETTGTVPHMTSKSGGKEILRGKETEEQGNGLTVTDKEGYYVADQLTVSVNSPEMDEAGYINGVYYFRSVSNTGVKGEPNWQPVMIQKEPVSDWSFAVAHKGTDDTQRVNTWYNAKSGLPTIFVDEKHDSYQAPLCVTYTLKRNENNTGNDADYLIVSGYDAKTVWLENNSPKQELAGVIDEIQLEEGVYAITVSVTDIFGATIWENTEAYVPENVIDQQEFKCDTTKPEISITYVDENGVSYTHGDSDKPPYANYYNGLRKAIVKVTDLSFTDDGAAVSLNGVNFSETRTDIEGEKIYIGNRTHNGECVWTRTEDGRYEYTLEVPCDGDATYEFGLTVTDIAGNDAVRSSRETFTVDKTNPEVEIDYSSNWFKKLPKTNEQEKLRVEYAYTFFYQNAVTVTVEATDNWAGIEKDADVYLFDARNNKRINVTSFTTTDAGRTIVAEVTLPEKIAESMKEDGQMQVHITDRAENQSKEDENSSEKAFIFDNTKGKTIVTARTASGEAYTDTNAKWTEDNVVITLSDASNLASGVDYYQYVFISQEELDTAKDEKAKEKLIENRKADTDAWQKVPESSGNVMHVTSAAGGKEMLDGTETEVQGKGMTVAGKDGYYVADQLTISEKCPEMDADGYINGYYYFRSVSNTGIIGEVSDAQPVMVQKTLVNGCNFAVAHKYIIENGVEANFEEKENERVNAWYNEKSGLPTIFVDEKHDKYQAPLTVTYTLKRNKNNTGNDADYEIVNGYGAKSVQLENSSYKTQPAETLDHIQLEEGVYTITASVTDIFGNTIWENTEEYVSENVKDQQVFKCDITEPIVDIKYVDENGDSYTHGESENPPYANYYNRLRKAIVTVTDLSFTDNGASDALNGVNFSEKRTDTEGEKTYDGNRTHNGDCVWTRAEDGRYEYTLEVPCDGDATYKFGLSVTDIAGNTTIDSTREEFTVDKKEPEVTKIEYSSNWFKKLSKTNEQKKLRVEYAYTFFYQNAVTVTITATDNWAGIEKDADVYLFDARNEKRIHVTSFAATDAGRKITAKVTLPEKIAENMNADGQMQVHVTDRANNVSGEKPEKAFIFDTTVGATTVEAITASGAAYTDDNADWTTDNVKITLSDASNLASGVDYYQYVFISQEELDTAQDEKAKEKLIEDRMADSDAWQMVPETSGNVMHVTSAAGGKEMLEGKETEVQGKGMTVADKDGYYVADQLTISEKCPEMDADGYINGYYYFRSVSNTGIIGEVSIAQPVMVQKTPVNGWSFAVVHTDTNDAQRVNAWYNAASGLPTVHVEETHDPYQAPLKVTYTLRLNANNTGNAADYAVVEGYDGKEVQLTNSSAKQRQEAAMDWIALSDGVYEMGVQVADVFGNIIWTNYDKDIDQQEFKCDATAPVIDVQYQTTNESTFYNVDRIATVTVTDLSFTADGVVFDETKNQVSDNSNTPGSGWARAGEAYIYSTDIVFHDDADYQFTLSVTDEAGNFTARPEMDSFTIDQTKPVVDIELTSESQVQNSIYYSKSVVATIKVTEHNFDRTSVRPSIAGTATDKGSAINFPAESGWTRAGDVYTSTITFDTDGNYAFTVSYTDPAGNVMDPKQVDTFVVDQTAPTMEIKGIGRETANKDEKLGFTVTSTDTNANKFEVVLMRQVKVEKEGRYVIENQKVEEDHVGIANRGDTFTFSNLDADGVYYLSTCEATDKAGNTWKEVKYIDANGNEDIKKSEEFTQDPLSLFAFSVNRKGSTFYVKTEPENLLDEYYTQTEPNTKDKKVTVSITEINVDEDAAQEETNQIRINSSPQDVTDKTYQTVAMDKEKTNIPRGGWHQNVYTMSTPDFFTEDGEYVVSIVHKDRAGNVNDSSLNEYIEGEANLAAETSITAVKFAVDNTEPKISVPVLENNAVISTDEQLVTINVKDTSWVATKLDERENIEVFVDGKEVTDVEHDKDLDPEGQYSFTLSTGVYDKIEIRATDLASNESVFTIDDVTISTNVFVRIWAFIRHNALICSLVGILVVAAVSGGIFFIIMFRRRHEDEELEQQQNQ